MYIFVNVPYFSWNNGRKFPCVLISLMMLYTMPSQAAACDRWCVVKKRCLFEKRIVERKEVFFILLFLNDSVHQKELYHFFGFPPTVAR